MFPSPARHAPELDPGFVPAVCWNRRFRETVAQEPRARAVSIQICRPDGMVYGYDTRLLPDTSASDEANWRYCERLVKTLLWAWGGNEVRVAGAPEIAARLAQAYASDGERAFDEGFMGRDAFRQRFVVTEGLAEAPERPAEGPTVSRSEHGCRVGFDLGGSDRKCAALIDGKVVFSEEIPWSPYFESDPDYHIAGIEDSVARAAAHLPRVDAIGGSAAGIYIDNEPRVGSLFRGIRPEDFEARIRPLFHRLRERWGGVPVTVANDGDVTALAGARALARNRVLGIAMGTSMAVGYVDGQGCVTGWLNELAFVPVDYGDRAPVDEWSGDRGCGVRYFSQQAVSRLLPRSGIAVSPGLTKPEQLVVVQERMARGDERAAAIYRTIGTCFGYALAHYAEFYDYEHLLLLGRVSSGEGGGIIEREAERVLAEEFPEIAARVSIHLPDEKTKRHGQAVAAALLPVIEPNLAPVR